MLLAVGPFVDKLLAKQWILDYEFSVPALTCLAWSCGVAVLVNISQFMCLGRFSAVTFQVGVGPASDCGREEALIWVGEVIVIWVRTLVAQCRVEAKQERSQGLPTELTLGGGRK